VLFELMAGAHPFRGRRLEETIELIRRPRPVDLRQWAPDCPEAVALFFARGLDRDPAKRPGSAGALRSELQDLLGDLA
jgi:serine/threonine-protein kinase